MGFNNLKIVFGLSINKFSDSTAILTLIAAGVLSLISLNFITSFTNSYSSSGLIILLSLLLNLFLLKKLQTLYLLVNNIRLDPVDIKLYSQENFKKQPNHQSSTVVLFGDSRAYEWVVPELDNLEFINRGISGQTSAQALLRFDEHISYLQPDIIILQVGVNDIKLLPLLPKTQKDIVEACKYNIKRIVEKAQNLGASVIVTTIFPLAHGKIPYRSRPTSQTIAEIEKNLSEVNDYIHSLENEENVIVFDSYKILEDDGKVKKKYARDLLHLNENGYEALNKDLSKILTNL